MQTSSSVPEPSFNVWQKCGHWLVARFVGIQTVTSCSALRFSNGSWQACSLNPAIALFRIVPRALYGEYQRHYPIVDVKDLRAVLQQDYPSQTLHLIAAAEHNQRRVTSYVFDQSMLESLQHPCFLLPESLLLALSSTEWPTTMQVQAEPDWFIFYGAQGVISQRPNALVQNLPMFRLAQGVSETVPHVDLPAAALAGLYVKGLKKLSSKQLVALFYQAKIAHVLPDWRPLLAIPALVLVLHLFVSSWLVNAQLTERQAEIDALGPQMDELLSAQQQHQQLTAQISAVAAQQQQTVFIAPIWQLITSLVEANVILSVIEQQGMQLQLRGTAARATEVLSNLQKDPAVAAAVFAAPTRRANELEQFHIQVTLKAGAADAEK